MKKYAVKFIPSTADSFDEHLQRMLQRGTWATHLEIFATASLLQIPIYIASQRSKTMVYYWEIYSPQSCNSVQYCSLKEHGLGHIELAHVQRCHYITVKTNSGSQPEHPPPLEGTETYHPLNNDYIIYLFHLCFSLFHTCCPISVRVAFGCQPSCD